ncbi:hypothetical protein XELAEV_18029840mg [Xenopus laevis]|uniref:Uncharacterized protein n=1 Tax=Xenopus laevis TaxID=8355 RepID=A0A974HIF8_XENLA|nr:hypothetical protein XELAEV_18029840mg [Xenopus laevis]
MPNKLDLQSMGSDLKQTIFAEMATLKQELTNVRDAIEELEDCITQINADTQAQAKTLQKHDQAILDLRQHTEDLENTSRRCNIRICGIPKNVPNEELRDLAVKLFSVLAVSTITQRRLLRPLTLALREDLDIPIPEISEWRNYIMGPPEEVLTAQPGEIPSTPTRRRDFTPSRQWRKRLNAQTPTQLPNSPHGTKNILK